jgi:hypothetical protein
VKAAILSAVFLDSFPPRDQMQEGILYISMPFASVAHLCACGCGEQVVTPLRPGSWELHYDGRGITLSPSIGNYEFPCRSHYYIRANRIVWVEKALPRRRSWLARLFRWK